MVNVVQQVGLNQIKRGSALVKVVKLGSSEIGLTAYTRETNEDGDGCAPVGRRPGPGERRVAVPTTQLGHPPVKITKGPLFDFGYELRGRKNHGFLESQTNFCGLCLDLRIPFLFIYGNFLITTKKRKQKIPYFILSYLLK